MHEDIMRPRLAKVTVSISVGEAGERLAKAEQLLGLLTGRKPSRTYAKSTNRDFGIRKGMPIGCKVTLRGKEAYDFLQRAVKAKNNTLRARNFDRMGNFAFGLAEYTDLEGIRYNPELGMFGMDVNVTLERMGYRIERRKIRSRSVPAKHRVKHEEAIAFARSLGVEVVE
jgi:large subunit ribosomal protein L5